MYVLSFDVGTVNLSFCMLRDATIVVWKNITLEGKTSADQCRSMVEQLDDVPELLDADVVLVEKQPKCNPKMRSVAETIKAYFIIRSCDIVPEDLRGKLKVVDWSPAHKLKCYEGPVPEFAVKSAYRKRKKLAVYHCTQLVQRQPRWAIEQFESSKKKDDLADAFLQATSYVLFKFSILSKPPTKRQYKYATFSKHNLKFLLKQYLGDRLDRTQDRAPGTVQEWARGRAEKSFRKHYGDPGDPDVIASAIRELLS